MTDEESLPVCGLCQVLMKWKTN